MDRLLALTAYVAGGESGDVSHAAVGEADVWVYHQAESG
jgi:hypothetical protein